VDDGRHERMIHSGARAVGQHKQALGALRLQEDCRHFAGILNGEPDVLSARHFIREFLRRGSLSRQ
jgi:hypothetical protein